MRLLVSGLVILIGAAGCGEATIPLAEYVKRAESICRDNRIHGRPALGLDECTSPPAPARA